MARRYKKTVPRAENTVVLTEECSRPSESVGIKSSPGMNDRVFRADFFEYAAADSALKASPWIRTKNIDTV